MKLIFMPTGVTYGVKLCDVQLGKFFFCSVWMSLVSYTTSLFSILLCIQSFERGRHVVDVSLWSVTDRWWRLFLGGRSLYELRVVKFHRNRKWCCGSRLRGRCFCEVDECIENRWTIWCLSNRKAEGCQVQWQVQTLVEHLSDRER